MVYKHAISTIVPGRRGRVPPRGDEDQPEYSPSDSPNAPTFSSGLILVPRLRRLDKLEELGLPRWLPGGNQVAAGHLPSRAPDAALHLLAAARPTRSSAGLADWRAGSRSLDANLSPAQQRNLESHLEPPVNDRTILILANLRARARSQKANCRSNWRDSSTCQHGWCAVGPTWSDKRGHRRAWWPR